MKIILLQNVPKVGKQFEAKTVADGYAMNFLIPHGLARNATPEAVKNLEEQQRRYADRRKLSEELLIKNAEALEGNTFEIVAKTNEKGHLFAGIHEGEIVKAIKEKSRLDVPEHTIEIAEPIKNIGTFDVGMRVGERVGTFKLVVKKEK